MSDFDQTSQSFLSWFTSQPGTTFDPRLTLSDLRSQSAGRGIIATQDIPADTALFTIPRKSVLSIENSKLSTLLPNIFSTLRILNAQAEDDAQENDSDDDDEAPELVEGPDPWLDLILVLVYEFLQGDSSPWKPYFDVLPTDFDTLMFWGEAEVAELQASAVKDRIGRASADEMFKIKILPVVREHADVFYGPDARRLGDDEVMALAHRMGSVIMAYAFDLDSEDDDDEDEDEDGWTQDRDGLKQMGMVPMADMLNADAEFNAHLNHEEDSLTMTSLRPIKAGEEVLNYYGPLPNCDLLRRYGYTSQKHTRYDVVELPWTTIKACIDTHLGKPTTTTTSSSAMDNDDDDDDLEESFVLERESGDPDETGLTTSPAEFVAFPEDLADQITRFTAPALGFGQKVDKMQKRRLKTVYAEILVQAIEKRLAQYGTTAEEDQALLADEKVTGRLRMAVEVRLGEKVLLREAQVVAQGLVERYSELEGQTEDGEPSAKRQKR